MTNEFGFGFRSLVEILLDELRQDDVEAQVIAYLDELREQELTAMMLTIPGSDDCSGTFRWDSA
jgi:hypothetical protein